MPKIKEEPEALVILNKKLHEINALPVAERRAKIREKLIENATQDFPSCLHKKPLFKRDGVKDSPELQDEILRLAEEFVDMVLLDMQRKVDENLLTSNFSEMRTRIKIEETKWYEHARHCLETAAQNHPNMDCNLGSVCRLAAITASQLGEVKNPIGWISPLSMEIIGSDFKRVITHTDSLFRTEQTESETAFLQKELSMLNSRNGKGGIEK